MIKQKGEIQIRKIVETDLRIVMDIEQLLHDEGRKQIWPFSFESYWEILHPNVGLVAELDGDVVGFVIGKIVKLERRKSIFGRLHTGEPYSLREWVGWVDMIGIQIPRIPKTNDATASPLVRFAIAPWATMDTGGAGV